MPRTRRVSAENAAAQEYDASQTESSSRRAKGKRGGLENMPNMPLDILVEIMGYLMPMDLLNLARTSRDFRSFLMARSATPLWKAARQNVEGLPDCPVDLSEPAYANLAFDSHCHGCGQPGTKTILWALRVRFCPRCRHMNLKWCHNHRASLFTEFCFDMVLPYTSDGGKRSHWHLASAVHGMTEIFDTLTKDELKDIVQKNKAIMDHAVQCEMWQKRAAALRNRELDDIRSRRLAGIVAKLRGLGWGAELDQMAPEYKELRLCPDVKQAKELTERVWEKIEPAVVAYMQDLQLMAATADD
ncbi:F-box protein [Phanerochaete sordida]|uniref:F-box protein n=1 Tax=Phanerochaete sordida TaxID=48140 RepID=A0A9P3LF09_9APHY|nr:F-box protein [Phanerochaete sordida]